MRTWRRWACERAPCARVRHAGGGLACRPGWARELTACSRPGPPCMLWCGAGGRFLLRHGGARARSAALSPPCSLHAAIAVWTLYTPDHDKNINLGLSDLGGVGVLLRLLFIDAAVGVGPPPSFAQPPFSEHSLCFGVLFKLHCVLCSYWQAPLAYFVSCSLRRLVSLRSGASLAPS